MNNNIIPLSKRSANDMDAMVRLCNSPAQQLRRMEKREAARREHMKAQATITAALLSVGTVAGFILGLML